MKYDFELDEIMVIGGMVVEEYQRSELHNAPTTELLKTIASKIAYQFVNNYGFDIDKLAEQAKHDLQRFSA
jgi:hypothetical protein